MGGVISRLRSTSKIWFVFCSHLTHRLILYEYECHAHDCGHRKYALLTLHTQKLTKNRFRSGQDFSLRELMFDEEFSLWILLENCLRKSRNPKTQASLWVRSVNYVPRLTWEIMVKGKSMRFWTNFVFCDHRITSQHNTTTVNLFLVVTAQRFLDKNLAWECWYDSVPYCFCSIFWARDPLSTSLTRQLWKPPNSTAVYRTSAEVHLHLP